MGHRQVYRGQYSGDVDGEFIPVLLYRAFPVEDPTCSNDSCPASQISVEYGEKDGATPAMGHVFQGRYQSIPIEADTYAKELSRYMH